MKSLSFVATGDSFITRRIPCDADFQDLAGLIKAADVRFTNLETVLRRDEGFPAAQSGGTWASSPPEVLGDLEAYGFNLLAWANNHTLDYSYGGLEATRHYLDAAGFVHAGAGGNLAEAGAIRYLDVPGGRVALIAATSSFHESWMAGEQRCDGPGRPGINPLRFTMEYRVSPEQLRQIQTLGEATGINADHARRVQEGFVVEDQAGRIRFGQHVFVEAEGNTSGPVTRPHVGDLRRLVKCVQEAARGADAVLVSIHSHEGEKDTPADFLVTFARACVDAGAHAVIGHGPHVLRGIEVYRNRPIFYSLGNFIFQNESVGWQPSDFYEKYGLDSALTISEVFAQRSHDGKRGLALNPKVWHSAIASWKLEQGELQELTLHPISLGFGEPTHRRGTPRLAESLDALEEVVALSGVFGTAFAMDRAKAVWKKN
jgi:poly-gamma-glutamate capsule biosynthesis protein CapA/YwtB (metallophosphatase superfamily)